MYPAYVSDRMCACLLSRLHRHCRICHDARQTLPRQAPTWSQEGERTNENTQFWDVFCSHLTAKMHIMWMVAKGHCHIHRQLVRISMKLVFETTQTRHARFVRSFFVFVFFLFIFTFYIRFFRCDFVLGGLFLYIAANRIECMTGCMA